MLHPRRLGSASHFTMPNSCRTTASPITLQVMLVDGFGVLHPRRLGSASQLGVLAGVPTIGVAKNLLAVDGLPGEREVRAAVRAAQQAQQAQHSMAEQGVKQEGDWQQEGSGREEVQAGSIACLAGLPPHPAGQHGFPSAAAGSPDHPKVPSKPPAPASAPAAAAMAAHPLSSPPMPPPLLLRGEGGEVLGAAVCPPGCQHPIYVSVGHLVSLSTAVDITLRCCKHRWVR